MKYMEKIIRHRSLQVFFFGLILSLGFSACDKIEKPYIANTPNGGGDTTGTKTRKVLIEDFTGQKCGNCPGAAATINTIKGIYGEKVISVALYTNFYATPSGAPYTYDFRTTFGNDYDATFQPVGWPAGMINRRGYPTTTHWQNMSSWADTVGAVLALPQEANIVITNNYNSSARVLNTSIRSEFLTLHNGNYKLIVLLTEDSIVKPQYFGPPISKDSLNYVHRHVLRDGISSNSWGETLLSGTIVAGDTAVKTYNYTLPAAFPATNGIAPNENLCYVVAYIYDAATYEVIQAEEKKIK